MPREGPRPALPAEIPSGSSLVSVFLWVTTYPPAAPGTGLLRRGWLVVLMLPCDLVGPASSWVPDTVLSLPQKPSMFDVSREMGSSIALYSRKVLIQTKATDILPKWLRFVRGTALMPVSVV